MAQSNRKKLPLKPLPWFQGFLAVLSETGSVARSCEAAGISQSSAYSARRLRPDFEKEWEEALQKAADDIEQEIRRRGLKGVKEDVYFQGQIVGERINYSDTLLMFYAKGLMPEKYRDRISADINSKVTVDLSSEIMLARKRAAKELPEKTESE